MPTLRVWISLPYFLHLSAGDYRTASAGESVVVGNSPPAEVLPKSTVSAVFQHPSGPFEIERLHRRDANQLLKRTNHLLRRYRATSRRAEITELTRAQVSPFRYESVGSGDDAAWLPDLEYEEVGPQSVQLTTNQLTAGVQAGLASGTEPDVAVLFLLDAERAIHQGRFREAVLFSWSTIDSVFNRKYEAVAAARLADEWASAGRFFLGHEFGMQNKMSAGLHLLTGRSLAREPGDFWERLSASYDRRNAIIHRGENATEDEGRQALDVARRVVGFMNAIPAPDAAAEQP